MAPIGFYVHHHGSGHATRCRQIAAAWPDDSPIHVFTSAPKYFAGWKGGTVHTLPPDVEEGRDPNQDLLTGEVFHYAPVGMRSVTNRMATMANWMAENDPKLFIVDLSCEVALFARLCGVNVALVRLHGYRKDPAHTAAFRLADTLLAPFPPCLEDDHTPDWVKDKTIYLGLFSRYDGRKETREACYDQMLGRAYPSPEPELARRLRWQRHVAVVNGSGGKDQNIDYWEQVARHNADHHFHLLGRLDRKTSEVENLTIVGYLSDTFPYLRGADIIIGSGGTNTMGEIGAASGRFLSLPEERPYGEQVYKMKALAKYGLTRIVESETDPKDWRKWLRRANDLQPSRWRRLRRTAKFKVAVDQLAERYSGKRIDAPAILDLPFGGQAQQA
ncbi:hypothetical protein A3850_006490 [Lewinella sp. 4G2]|nr:hypothetical protein A3850_006490 [Lewinella sp. 4G2]